MRRQLFSFIFLFSSLLSFAGTDVIEQLIADLTRMNGAPHVVEEHDGYVRIQLTDSATLEAQEFDDSVVVLTTVCAPQCSSCARVYNKEWQLLHTIAPDTLSIFPLATFENGKLIWRDNDNWEY